MHRLIKDINNSVLPNRSKMIHLFQIFLFSLLFVSCSKEDDIDSIFNGRTWYITGASINGSSINGEEIKSIYSVLDSYLIYFSSSNTFSGKLVSGSIIEGKWNADGKHQSIFLQFTKDDNVKSTTLSNNIYNILRNASSYNGDVNNLEIKQDGSNYVRMSKNKK